MICFRILRPQRYSFSVPSFHRGTDGFFPVFWSYLDVTCFFPAGSRIPAQTINIQTSVGLLTSIQVAGLCYIRACFVFSLAVVPCYLFLPSLSLYIFQYTGICQCPNAVISCLAFYYCLFFGDSCSVNNIKLYLLTTL